MAHIKAFSLLEILIVIALISLLSVFAHSEYIAYVQRAKISEALNILEEYQTHAIALRARSGSIAPYYVLFTDADQTGLITGTPAGTSASKTVDLKYVDNIVAISGTSGGEDYILLGAQLQHDGPIVEDEDFVYVAGIENSSGVLRWECGVSASQANTVNTKFLPPTCQSDLP